MRFLFVHYVPSGGVDSLNRHRCKALRTYGHEGHCLYYSQGSGKQNIRETPTFITNIDHEIAAIIAQNNYDAIIATTDFNSFPRFRALGFTGKFVLEIQGYGAQEVARNELTRGQECITAYAAGLLNPKTAHISNLFSELFPTIPQFNFNNPFDHEAFTYQASSRFMQPIIAWIGRIEDNKNWREFLNIGHLLINQYNSNIRLWMFEDPALSIPSEREAFFSHINELKLAQYITLYPNVPNDQMPHYYSTIGDSGGFLCLTSKEEGGPYCVLEAMSCRCPVVSSRKDGIMSTVYHNVTGKLYTLGNVVEAFAEAVNLMSSPQKREQIRNAAQHHIQNGFTLEQYAHHFITMMISI